MPIYSPDEEKRLGFQPTVAQPAIPRAQAEDNKNMAFAGAIMGQGTPTTPYRETPLERFSPAGEVPYGVSVPGVPRGAVTEAIPKTFDVLNQEFANRLTTGAPTVPGGGDVERAMATTTPFSSLTPYSGTMEKVTSRLSAVLDRLASPLRKVTRTNLVSEAGQLMQFLQGVGGTEAQKGMKTAELAGEHAGRAIPGIAALTGMRKQAGEEAMLPWEAAGKMAEIEKARAGAGYYGAEEAKTKGELAIQPQTRKEMLEYERAKGAPYPQTEKPSQFIDFYKANLAAESQKVKPDYAGARQRAIEDYQSYTGGFGGGGKPTKEQFRKTTKAKGSKLSDAELDQYYNENYGE